MSKTDAKSPPKAGAGAQDSRRNALSEFLKSRRARITPAQAGLPEPERKRTPGLRREDVAALSGLSVTWYTWLEQGREVRASAEALERIAETLRLTGVEREYLFELARGRPAPLPRGGVDSVTPAMERMLSALTAPAYITTMRWDVVAWNPMCAAVLRDYGEWPDGSRNLLRILFASEDYPGSSEEHQAMAHRLVAKLRVDYSQFPGDPGLETLVSDLTESYPLFQKLWTTPDLTDRSEGAHIANHPDHGAIHLEHSSYVPEGAPTLRVVIFAPTDPESADKLDAIRETLDPQ